MDTKCSKVILFRDYWLVMCMLQCGKLIVNISRWWNIVFKQVRQQHIWTEQCQQSYTLKYYFK